MSATPPRLVADRFELRLADEVDVPRILAYRRDNADFFAPFEPLPAADHFTEDFWLQQVA